MPIAREEAVKQCVLDIGRLMLVSARTAPKGGGVDDIVMALVSDPEKERLADDMDRLAVERGISGFKRDGQNVKDSDAVVLIGVRSSKAYGLSCGACGYTCDEFNAVPKKMGIDFLGPTCLIKNVDLGIALGSAAKTAGVLNVDNRIMYRIGVSAMRLKMLPEADVIMGIPISAKGKSPYFDRK